MGCTAVPAGNCSWQTLLTNALVLGAITSPATATLTGPQLPSMAHSNLSVQHFCFSAGD